MAAQNGPLELTDLGLSKVNIEVRFAGESESESAYRPAFVRLGPEGMFLHWPDPPSDLQKLQIEWSDCPFTAQPFRCECTVLESSGEGLQVKLDGPTPVTMKEWFERISTLANQREPDSALKTSKLYTGATATGHRGPASSRRTLPRVDPLQKLADDPRWESQAFFSGFANE